MERWDKTIDLLKENESIIIDTSTLMHYRQLQKLVDSLEFELLVMNKKIKVPRVVWCELMKHLDSYDQVKAERAIKAVEIISLHRNIFDIDDAVISAKEKRSAFADKELLTILMNNKTTAEQLLITNDRDLGFDAQNLNTQKSIAGEKITVCFITNEGLLVDICDDFSLDNENAHVKEKVETPKSTPLSSVEKPSSMKNTALKVAEFAAMFAGGYILGNKFVRLV